MVGDVCAGEMEIKAVVGERGVGHEAEVAVAGERAFVPLARELFPNEVVTCQEGGPVDRVANQRRGRRKGG